MKWKIFGVFLFLLIFLVFPVKANAQVVINEFSPGSSSDWIEIYNNATESADLSVYKLKDSTESNDKVLSGLLVPGGFTFFTFSNYLNNDGDIVRLFKNDILVDSVNYGDQGGICAADSSQSLGRSPDGVGGFVLFSSQTQGSENNSSQSACSTPAPTASPTPTPTATPSPTPSPTPSATPTKSPSPTPIRTPSRTSSPIAFATEEPRDPGQGEVLGLGTNASPSPLVVSDNVEKRKFPLAAVLFITGGLAFVGLALFMLFRSYQKEKIENTPNV